MANIIMMMQARMMMTMMVLMIMMMMMRVMFIIILLGGLAVPTYFLNEPGKKSRGMQNIKIKSILEGKIQLQF